MSDKQRSRSLKDRWNAALNIKLELQNRVEERKKLKESQRANTKRLKQLVPLIENLQQQLFEELEE